MHLFLGLLASYAFLLGLYKIADQVKRVCRWIVDRTRYR